jgi:hypothetical protein
LLRTRTKRLSPVAGPTEKGFIDRPSLPSLPEVDDGAVDLKTSLAMARMSVAEKSADGRVMLRRRSRRFGLTGLIGRLGSKAREKDASFWCASDAAVDQMTFWSKTASRKVAVVRAGGRGRYVLTLAFGTLPAPAPPIWNSNVNKG